MQYSVIIASVLPSKNIAFNDNIVASKATLWSSLTKKGLKVFLVKEDVNKEAKDYTKIFLEICSRLSFKTTLKYYF